MIPSGSGSPAARPARRPIRWPSRCSSSCRDHPRPVRRSRSSPPTSATRPSKGAARGLYPPSITEDVSPQRLRRFFTKVEGGYQIAKAVRDLCVFARQDLARDPPFSKLDLIVCRNVLIYLDPVLHQRVMTVFHYALKPGGFLMLGRAESVGTSFRPVPAGREESAHLRPQIAPARGWHMDLPAVGAAGDKAHARPRAGRAPGESGCAGRGHPAAAVALRSAGRADRRRPAHPAGAWPYRAYLELAPGDASLHLLKMAREGLLFGLRGRDQRGAPHGRGCAQAGRCGSRTRARP